MEAAVVLPFIILSVITVILITMFFYSQISSQCSMHMALRAESGNVTGRSSVLHSVSSEAEFYTRKKAFGGVVEAKEYLIMDHRMLLDRKGVCLIQDKAYAVDGVRYVRYCCLVKGVNGNESDEK